MDSLMYKGKKLKPGVTIEKKMVHGEMREVLNIPAGCRNPYVDEIKAAKRKTTKANPEKAGIVNEVLDKFLDFAADGKIYKTKQGKFTIKTNEGKWYSLSIVANKTEPVDKTELETKVE